MPFAFDGRLHNQITQHENFHNSNSSWKQV
jgi:hypothetical protein